MASVDPTSFVSNLARPGGNVTGVAGFTCETAAKRLQLLKEAVPTVTRIAVLRNPSRVYATPSIGRHPEGPSPAASSCRP
jgi:putative tryptophan/tyrosine transport system substrate-binding protein